MSAHAQTGGTAASYPSKPIRILVGFAPGGGIDIMARFYAQRLTEDLKHSVVVENRPGAGGTIATDLVAKAAADGHTLIAVSITHSINASLYSKLPYDTVKDFAPVSPLAWNADVIAVHPSVPTKSLRELIALAKQSGDKLSYASAGSGTLMHLGMELFNTMAGIKMTHIPYNGAGPSTVAVLGGQLPVLSTSLPAALPHGKSGKLRVLAVTTLQRTALAPEYPTVIEAAGLAGYEAVVWVGLLAPAGTPAAIVNKLNADVQRIAERREVREQLAALGADPHRESPAAFAERIRTDIVKWGKVVRDTGAKVD
ncbi:MAG: tripartite tricarboxylate transporter substrate binding protein [Burkholderiales bacterium]|nr:tripartite tricarboxylate transporter substrate binding protein [Burkholderiales bacterium]